MGPAPDLRRGLTLHSTLCVVLITVVGMYLVLWSTFLMGNQSSFNYPQEVPPLYPGTWLVLRGNDSMSEAICEQVNHAFQRILVFNTSHFFTLSCHGKSYMITPHTVSNYPRPISTGRSEAYLYAIKAGAEYIYTVDSLQSLQHMNQSDFYSGPVAYSLFYAGKQLSLPHHFGCEGESPYQEPEDVHMEDENKTTGNYVLCNTSFPTVKVQVLHSDADSFWSDQDTACNYQAPPVSLIHPYAGLLFDMKNNALFHRRAFWALPVVDFLESSDELTWSYCVQLLLNLTGDSLQMYKMGRSSGTHKISMDDTTRIYIEIMIKRTLKGVSRLSTKLLRKIVLDLSAKNMLLKLTANDLAYWLKAIEAVWVAPVIRQSIGCPHQVVYYPWLNKPSQSDLARRDMYLQNKYLIGQTFQNTCSSVENNRIFNGLNSPRKRLDNIALVIIFLWPNYSPIPFLESLYRPFFSVIVYCLPTFFVNSLDYKKFLRQNWRFTVVEYNASPYNAYQCVELVVGLHLQVDGYIFLQDDVLLAVPNILEKPLSDPWLAKEVKACDVKDKLSCEGHSIFYHLPVKESIFKTYYDMLSFPYGSVEKRCIDYLHNSSSGVHPFYMANADMYYLPKRIAREFAQLVPIFLRNGVFHEIAIPSMIKCLTYPNHLEPIMHNLYWSAGRRNEYDRTIIRVLRGGVDMLHPVKLSFLAERKAKHVNTYCNKIIPFFYKNQRTNLLPETEPVKYSMFSLTRASERPLDARGKLEFLMIPYRLKNRTNMQVYLGKDFESNPKLKRMPDKYFI